MLQAEAESRQRDLEEARLQAERQIADARRARAEAKASQQTLLWQQEAERSGAGYGGQYGSGGSGGGGMSGSGKRRSGRHKPLHERLEEHFLAQQVRR